MMSQENLSAARTPAPHPWGRGGVSARRRAWRHMEDMGASRIFAVCAAACACALAPASNAHAGWSSPFTVARSAYGVELATSARHGAIVAWLDRSFRRLRVDGT